MSEVANDWLRSNPRGEFRVSCWYMVQPAVRPAGELELIVKDDADERTVDVHAATVVIDEAKIPEAV